MAGTVTVNTVQLGDSVTATNNFFIKTNADGTGGLYRGTSPTSTQSILTWNASGAIEQPQAPAFSAYLGSNQSITNATETKCNINTEVFDTGNMFASSRFTPTIAGYYQINGVLRCGATSGLTVAFATIYKNGASYCRGDELNYPPSAGGSVQVSVSEVIYLNGSTDYVELWGYINASGGGSAFQFATTSATCRFSGALIKAG
jgi:hypothetical protein